MDIVILTQVGQVFSIITLWFPLSYFVVIATQAKHGIYIK